MRNELDKLYKLKHSLEQDIKDIESIDCHSICDTCEKGSADIAKAKLKGLKVSEGIIDVAIDAVIKSTLTNHSGLEPAE